MPAKLVREAEREARTLSGASRERPSWRLSQEINAVDQPAAGRGPV